jgi:KaiC/GvpD/RAD55 family RecA-like ATPase
VPPNTVVEPSSAPVVAVPAQPSAGSAPAEDTGHAEAQPSQRRRGQRPAPGASVHEAAAAASAAVSTEAPALPAPLPPRSTPGFQFQPALDLDGKLATGVERLDQLLGGGYTAGSATLLFGPPFCGKQQLQQQAIVRAARDGVPVTVLLHTIGAEAMSRRLQALDPGFAAAEQAGRVRYVDVHSKALGEPTEHPNATYVQDPHDVSAILRAIETPRGPRVPRASLLAIESASTILIDLGPSKAFTVLRTLLGRTLTAGGVGLVCLEGGMHPESEVQMAKHLCAGMIEMRKKGEAHCLHVEGLETAYARPGWIEYEFNSRQFKVTGSFASRTIR